VEGAPHRPCPTIPPLGTPAVQRDIPTTILSFDIGQTLVELDLDFLARRLGERGLEVAPGALVAASPAAWAHYDVLTDRGIGHPWRELMAALVHGAGVPAAQVDPAVEWLWEQQPTVNLFRRPIAPMVELARELQAEGTPLIVVSNSEGRLAELLAEIGLSDLFAAVVDSGRLGIEKPDRRIFEHALAQISAPADASVIHIGDAWSADITGALGAGWRAIWYGRRAKPVDDPRVGVAADAAGVRATLERWGVLAPR
jgi:HAD superfamily hydrolase (TIGR01549 family)